jgi:hypothetical protein
MNALSSVLDNLQKTRGMLMSHTSSIWNRIRSSCSSIYFSGGMSAVFLINHQ